MFLVPKPEIALALNMFTRNPLMMIPKPGNWTRIWYPSHHAHVQFTRNMFHFTQCIWRKTQQTGIQIAYQENDDIRHLVRIENVWFNASEDLEDAELIVNTLSLIMSLRSGLKETCSCGTAKTLLGHILPTILRDGMENSKRKYNMHTRTSSAACPSSSPFRHPMKYGNYNSSPGEWTVQRHWSTET